MDWNNLNLIKILENNGVVVMPTDTLYGIVGRAENPEVVERIYKLRKRNPEKPCIILIGGTKELEKFSVTLTEKQKLALKKYWPFDSAWDLRPVSVVLDCLLEEFSYLHRGTKTLAFRIPTPEALRNLLTKTGPLIAPSANTEGLPPAKTIKEARKYFGNLVDLYLDGGVLTGKASKIIKLHSDGSTSIIRG